MLQSYAILLEKVESNRCISCAIRQEIKEKMYKTDMLIASSPEGSFRSVA